MGQGDTSEAGEPKTIMRNDKHERGPKASIMPAKRSGTVSVTADLELDGNIGTDFRSGDRIGGTIEGDGKLGAKERGDGTED